MEVALKTGKLWDRLEFYFLNKLVLEYFFSPFGPLARWDTTNGDYWELRFFFTFCCCVLFFYCFAFRMIFL